MAVLDDIVGIAVFFTVNSFIARAVSGGSVLAEPEPELAVIVKGTIAAAAVINEIIAVIAAKKGFELAGEIKSV